ncbi:MAG TPA: hypothetical protein VNQ76_09845 [Planctomicrobium sp.]|nr:hypothetical protein [Planctomicrobium sp.]
MKGSLVPKLPLGNILDAKLCLATRQLAFGMNDEAELPGECVPKLEFGNEEVVTQELQAV